MGSLRLQKVLYFATKEMKRPPFTFIKYDYGQFSRDVGLLLDEMVDEGLVRHKELGGNNDRGSHWLTSDIFESEPIENALRNGFPKLAEAIDDAVRKYGRRQQDKLRQIAYEDPELDKASHREVLLAEVEEDEIPTMLDEDDVDDVEMLLSPNFLKEMSRFAKIVTETDLENSRANVDESPI